MEANEVTKLHKRDTTSSYDEFLRYAQSYKLILTTSTTHLVNNETPNLYSEGATLSNLIHEGRPTTTKLTSVALPSSINHSTFCECSKGILCLARISHQSFDETGCDYLLFPTPGKKDHVTFDIYYSLEDQKGIHTKEVNLLDFKEWHDLPSWYPIFQLPYQIDVKVTCTGFYVYIEIIYIDSSPDPDHFAPYVYNEPSDEFI